MESLNSDSTDAMREDFEEVFKMFKDDLEEDTEVPEGSASLAHASEEGDHGTAAMKARIIEKTKKFAEALESLNSDSADAMREDFEEVFKMFKDDLEEDTEVPEGSASLAHASEEGEHGTAAMKARIVEKTKHFAEAMESLNS